MYSSHMASDLRSSKVPLELLQFSNIWSGSVAPVAAATAAAAAAEASVSLSLSLSLSLSPQLTVQRLTETRYERPVV
jgi:hypothetical protein